MEKLRNNLPKAPPPSKKAKAKHNLDVLQAGHESQVERESLVHDLEVYQIELEMQNRELRESRLALETSRDRYANLYDFAPQGYVTLDSTSIVREINFTAASLLGQDRKRFRDTLFHNWIKRDDRPVFRKHMQDCVQSRPGEAVQCELSLISRDAAEIPVQLISVCAQDPEFGTPLVRTAIVNLSDFKRVDRERAVLALRERRARDEAERANRAKDEFFAVVSHELRTPLNVILGWVNMLKNEKLDAKTFEQAVDTIDRNAKVQKELIDDLLDVSRIMSDKLMMELGPLNFAGLVDSNLASVVPRAKAKGIVVHSDIVCRDLVIRGDQVRLSQVISNLLDNAIKFTPKGGEIFVRLEKDGQDSKLTIKDTGKGICPQFLPNVFDSLKQEDTGTTRAHGGLGLGLAIARHIVKRHRGEISAQSEGKGQGSAFTISFPLIDSASLKTEDLAKAHEPTGLPLNEVRILLVDDAPDVLALIALWLKRNGAIVRTAGSAREALETLKTFRPTVLLSDIGMPDQDGYALISEVRRLGEAHGGKVKAAALTAYARDEEKEHALEAGFQAHISKPVLESELIRAVRSLTKEMLH